MGQALLEQSLKTESEISPRREAARALSRVHGAIKMQNASQRSLYEALRPIIEELLHPGARGKAIPVADHLNREFGSYVRRTEWGLRAAIATDAVLMRELGPDVETLYKRLKGLERLAEPVRRAVAHLADPACDTTPLSLIHHGLEFIEHLKRHQTWVDHNILPAVVRRYREIVAKLAEDVEVRQSEEEMFIDVVAEMDASIERDHFGQPDETLQRLVRGLQARYGIHSLPDLSVPQGLPN